MVCFYSCRRAYLSKTARISAIPSSHHYHQVYSFSKFQGFFLASSGDIANGIDDAQFSDLREAGSGEIGQEFKEVISSESDAEEISKMEKELQDARQLAAETAKKAAD